MVRIATLQDAEQLEILNMSLTVRVKQLWTTSENLLLITSKKSLLSMSRTEN